MSTPKILFIMQRVSPGTHMDYVYEMARTLREDRGLPLTLLLEKPSGAYGEKPWVVTQHWRSPVLRAVENFGIILRARLRGTKTFYVHYSFLSAISAGLVTRVLGGHVYYWNAGMPWLYERSSREEWYQRLAYRLIHTLVTGADALRTGYSVTYGLRPEQIVVIPNWIDVGHEETSLRHRAAVRTKYGIPPDASVLLFVQKHAKRKGAHLVPEILRLLENRDAYLIMAGDGPLRSDIESAFAAHGLMPRVRMVGNVPRETVTGLYQAADIYLLPSEEEGSPHALIEALAYGLPAVTSDVGGVPETMTEALREWVVPYGDNAAFAQKVDLLLADQTLREATGNTARVVAKRYEKSKIVDRFYTLLSEK